jgi:hypothetical protein
VRVQAWDLLAGANFVLWIGRQMEAARRTVVLCSPSYFNSPWCTQEWTGALATRKAIHLRAANCRLPPVLGAIVCRNLFGVDESAVRLQQLQAVRSGLGRPDRHRRASRAAGHELEQRWPQSR